MTKEEELETLETEVFRALDHQIRRDVLRYVGEKKSTSFTAILNDTGVPDSPTLSYHLRNLAPFIVLKQGSYTLTPVGKSAYDLLLKTTAYNREAQFFRKKHGVMIGHVVLWLSAIAAGLVMGVDSFMTTIILPVLAGTSLITIEALFE